ncbi:MAG: VWA domain-containing protein [Methanomicrobiales archaeon]|nr:VWA domain-containing protein [Methanomicrobiales archaeon]
MRNGRVAWLLIGLFVLAASASAAGEGIPHHMVVSSPWISAGGNTASISVQVFDINNESVSGAEVTLQCLDPTLGKVSSLTYTTRSPDGLAIKDGQVPLFTANSVSGRANVSIAARKMVNGTLYQIDHVYEQKIDHAEPYKYGYLLYNPSAPVDSITPITICMADRYGNRIDNVRETDLGLTPEEVKFTVTSPGGEARFENGATTITRPVTVDGNVTVNLRLSSLEGEHFLVVSPKVASVGEQHLIITGIGYRPVAIIADVSPAGDPPKVPADGKSKFTVTFHVHDAWMNPVAHHQLDITTSLPGEPGKSILTNSEGNVMITYGPKTTIGTITIKARSAVYPEVNCSQVVQFVNTDPVSMMLTASPQSMPSLEVNPNSSSNIMAKVVDSAGNPVPNETVSFVLIPSTYPDSQVHQPYLLNSSTVSDEDGFAIVRFVPGEFKEYGSVGFDPQSRAECRIQATWRSNVSSIKLEWLNYPYLSVDTSVQPQTVAVNNTTDITIRLKGDGYALQPKPIDVVLCIDRSGSMLYDDPDRMHSVREAAKVFVDEMVAQDRVALVTFGRNGYISRPGYNSGISTSEIDNAYVYPKTYSAYATIDKSLSADFSSVKTALDRIVPDYATPMRYGLYRSINHLVSSGNPSSIKAVVVLSDGDYNYYGDPLARGTGYTGYDPDDFGDLTSAYYKFTSLGTGTSSNQNMSNYARNNNIIIYSIGYADSLSSGGRNTLRILAEGSGGKYYNGSASNIEDVYKAIAGDLKQEAGVNTAMSLSFDNVMVNNISWSGDNVFQYQYVNPESTRIYSYNETHEVIPEHCIDQTLDWSDRTLDFNIGTIHVGQVWETTFRMKVLKEGNINVFGSGSTISFNNGTEFLELPDTYITAVAAFNETGITTYNLEVSNLHIRNPDSIRDFVEIEWDTTYTGDLNLPVTEELSYSNDGEKTWTKFYSISTSNWSDDGSLMKTRTGNLDIRYLPEGEYVIRVYATAPDAYDSWAKVETVYTTSGNYIKLE